MTCQKRLNRSRCSLGFGLGVGPRKHVLDGIHIGATWRIRLNRPYVAVLQPFCQINLTTCFNFIVAGCHKMLLNNEHAVLIPILCDEIYINRGSFIIFQS